MFDVEKSHERCVASASRDVQDEGGCEAIRVNIGVSVSVWMQMREVYLAL